MYLFYVSVAILIYSFINFLDKFLISKYCKHVSEGALLVFSSLIGLPVAILIILFQVNPFQFSHFEVSLLIISGLLYIISLIPYMYALGAGDVSSVVPTFLMMPVISIIFGLIFLGEQIGLGEVIAMLIIIIGAFFISFSIDESQNLKFNKKMLLASLVYSLGISGMAVLFKDVALDRDYWAAQFWYQIGYVLAGIVLLIVPTYRKSFVEIAVRQGKFSIWSINMSAEALTSIADISFRYATLLGAVAVVQTVALGLQPIIVFVYSVILTLLFPKFTHEKLVKKELIRRFGITIIMIMAVFYLQ